MRLALREIRRAKIRFGLLAGAVTLLAFLILFQQALLSSLVTQFIGALRNQSAAVLVYGEEARRNVEGSVVTPEQVTAVGDVPGVAAAAPIGEGTFTVEVAGELRDAVLWGYRPGGPGEPTTLERGRLPERPGEAVTDARAYGGVELGDVVRVAPDGPTIQIVGVGSDLRYSVQPTLFTTFETFVRATRATNPDATGVLPSLVGVAVDAGADPSVVAGRIDERVTGVEALDRATAVDQSPGVASVRQSLGVVLLLTYVIVTLVTGFFFLILTVQKSGALTLLRALGAPGGYLVRALVAQVVVVVATGVVAASVLLLIVARVFSGTLGIDVDLEAAAITGVVLVVLATLASLAAVRRVLRVDPARAVDTAALGGLS